MDDMLPVAVVVVVSAVAGYESCLVILVVTV